MSRMDILAARFLCIQMQVWTREDKAFIDTVYVNVFRGCIAQEDRIDPGGNLLIEGHPGDSSIIIDPGMMLPLIFSYGLLRLKESRPSGNTDRLQSRGDCQADGLV